MLPDGWSDISLGDAFSFKNGLNGDKELYGAGTKFVNVMDVFRGPHLRRIGNRRVNENFSETTERLCSPIWRRAIQQDIRN